MTCCVVNGFFPDASGTLQHDSFEAWPLTGQRLSKNRVIPPHTILCDHGRPLSDKGELISPNFQEKTDLPEHVTVWNLSNNKAASPLRWLSSKLELLGSGQLEKGDSS